MLFKLLALCCLSANCYAWLAPERCAQGSRPKRSVTTAPVITDANTVRSVDEIATKQHEDLLERYKNHKFFGVPIRATTTTPRYKKYPEEIEIHAPYNCTFHTYDPELLSTVDCNNVECKLSRTVSTVDSYTASEGYNWGVTISSQVSLAKIFEVGGEASVDGSYSCEYTKERSTSDTVECSDSSDKSRHLQLFSVKSDMVCDFGGIMLVKDQRDHGHWDNNFYGPAAQFTSAEMQELKDSVQVYISPRDWFIMDTSKVSDSLYRKLINKVPLFNPYTDLVMVDKDNIIRVLYFKQTSASQEYRRVIPFTNEAGNSVYQYACAKF